MKNEHKTKGYKLAFYKSKAQKEFMCHNMKQANIWKKKYYNLLAEDMEKV